MQVNVLDSFAAKTKVRGQTRAERLEFVLSRWRKVSEDCRKSSDKSFYRTAYGKAHEDTLAPISKAFTVIQAMPEDKRAPVLDGFLSDLDMVRDTMINEIIHSEEPTGRTDALCYIIVEIGMVLYEED